jgi:hypothetical protein
MDGIKTDAMLLRVREVLLRRSHLSSDIILAYCIHTILSRVKPLAWDQTIHSLPIILKRKL